MIDPALIAAVRDETSLLALLKDEAGGLGWPILDPERGTRPTPKIADGVDFPGGDVSVRRLRPLSGEDTRPVFVVDFEAATYLRRDLRALLRSVRELERETAGVGATGIRDTLYIVAQEDWRDVRFVLFRPRTSGAPEIRSFGWRDGKAGRTALESNLPGLRWNRRDAWQDAFNVEGLTETFYEAFRRDFDAVKGEIVIQRMGGEVETNDARNEARRHEWTQLLFNRLLFVAFVERMGWFRRPDGTVATDYLHDLYQGPRGTFQTYLGMLRAVFEELDTPDDAPHKGARRPEVGTVPYLNGGLFAPDAVEANEIELPDASFERILGSPDALFRRYNFTVTESSPLDQEVAVDPEMLGKIFERLVNDRHAEGKYYTPRPIVGFMVDEAIKGYLVEGGLAPEKATLLVEEERLRAEDGGIHLDADEVGPARERLMAVRAVDPACGSGAYLLGLLQKLFSLVDLLNLGSRNARDLYRTKLALLQRCIYGVDLDPTAVSIARLRLWLSLTVENPEGYKPEPLPNLDFRIEAGDSLACPVAPPQPELYRDQLIRDFRDAKLAYANARPENRVEARDRAFALRDELRANVAHATPLMAASRKPFDWTVEFAEVFMEEAHPATMDGRLNLGAEAGRRGQGTFAAEPPRPGGFDIVLANPPYVRQEGIAQMGTAYKTALVKDFETGAGTADLLVYFFERAWQLLRQGGQLAFITSNKWLRTSYGASLRAFLAERANVRELLNYNGNEAFRGLPDAMPLVTILARGGPSVGPLRYTSLVRVPADALPSPLAARGAYGTTVAGGLSERRGAWNLPTFTQGEGARRTLRGTSLREVVGGRIYRGVVTGLNEVKIGSDGQMYGKAVPFGVRVVRKEGVFVIDGPTRARLISEEPQSAEIIKPLASGKAIRRWTFDKDNDDWLIVTRIGMDMSRYPAVMRHLSRYELLLRPRADQGEHWWQLRRCAYYEEFNQPKLILPEVAKDGRFVPDRCGTYTTSGYIIGTDEPDFLAAILNSQLVTDWYRENSVPYKDDFFKYMDQYISLIPIPLATREQKAEVEAFVRQILDLKAADPDADVSALEAEIDKRVEFLYFHADEAESYDAWIAARATRAGQLADEVRAMIQAGESSLIEFKQSLEYVDPQSPDLLKVPEAHRKQKLTEVQKAVVHSALKTVVAFLNSRGGTLLLGVHDSGTIIGIEPDFTLCGDKPNQDGFELKLLALLKSRVTPLPVDFEIKYAKLDGKTVAVVQVSPSATPHYLDTKLYIRLGNSTQELVGREIEDWLGRRGAPAPKVPAPDPEPPYEGIVPHNLPWQALPPTSADADPQLRKLKELGYQLSLPNLAGVAKRMGEGWQYVVWKSPDGAFFRLSTGFPIEQGNVWMMKAP